MNAPLLSLSPAAWRFVLRPATGEGRVIVVGRRKHGCAGWAYTLARHTQVPDGHWSTEVALADGPAWLAVAEPDVPHLQGSRGDLATQGLGQALVWDNPQVVGTCGCGISVQTA
jgi:iron-sulfur cluster assembly protein